MLLIAACLSAAKEAAESAKPVYVVFRPELFGETSVCGYVSIPHDYPLDTAPSAIEARKSWRLVATFHPQKGE